MQTLFQSVKRCIRRHPFLYFSIVGHRESVKRLRARRDSELVVEAYPRSANTTSMYALYYSQRSLKVGHHLHVPAHVKYAVRHKIPCLVIMRDPLDCVASLMVMRKGGDPVSLLKDYIDFARITQSLIDDLVLVSFEEVVTVGMGDAIDRLNSKFGKMFQRPTGSPEETAWVEAQVREWNRIHSGGDEEKLSIPSSEKKSKAVEMKELIQRAAAGELAVARKLYHSLIITKEPNE
jgi:hypothetical protein